MDDAEVVPVDDDGGMSAEHAQQLTEDIRQNLTDAWKLIGEAYHGRAWAALGYGSWAEYCVAEFGSARASLKRADRRMKVGLMHSAGLTIRAIAAALGVDKNTVLADLGHHDVSENSDTEGKKRRNKPRARPKVDKPPKPVSDTAKHIISELNEFTATVDSTDLHPTQRRDIAEAACRLMDALGYTFTGLHPRRPKTSTSMRRAAKSATKPPRKRAPRKRTPAKTTPEEK